MRSELAEKTDDGVSDGGRSAVGATSRVIILRLTQ